MYNQGKWWRYNAYVTFPPPRKIQQPGTYFVGDGYRTTGEIAHLTGVSTAAILERIRNGVTGSDLLIQNLVAARPDRNLRKRNMDKLRKETGDPSIRSRR